VRDRAAEVARAEDGRCRHTEYSRCTGYEVRRPATP
jgi:hypothetical protein